MIVALTGQKGGVGKSTLAICIASELLARRHKVLLVDADPQGTVRTWGEVAAEAGQPQPSIVAMGSTMHRPEQLPTVRQGYDDVVIGEWGYSSNTGRAYVFHGSASGLSTSPTTTFTGAIFGGRTRPLSSEWLITKPPIRRVLTPQLVCQT